MKKWSVIVGAGVAALALSVVASAQSASSPEERSPATGMQRTPAPATKATPMAGGMKGHAPTGNGPAVASDCSNSGWQNYPDQHFKDQKGCEKWVKKHASTKGAAGAHSMSHTPRPGTSSPGSGGTAPMAPTPVPPQR